LDFVEVYLSYVKVYVLPAALREAQSAGIYFTQRRILTRCTDWGEIWHGGGDPSSLPNLTPIGATVRYRTPKLKYLLRFDQNVQCKRPAGAYPLRDFHEFCRICKEF